ncbi:unnamed protein product [Phytomonas sp. EM1]|nr:unnamed protein product [Phytomonas sp. EM1]|eukprot:CCW63105.1 unnamed protein product [Phytomonas sp. isolate EM1]
MMEKKSRPTLITMLPIITSILDTDVYKLYMQQAVFHQNRDVHAEYEFNSRDHECFGEFADVIRKQVNCMASVVLSDEEYDYLSGLPQFKMDYLNYLRSYRFNPKQVTIRAVPAEEEGHSDALKLVVVVQGPWVETILWEIPLLAIISEVVQNARHPTIGIQEALETLHRNLDNFFAAHSEEELESFRVSDFGSRRRFSQVVHEAVVRALHEHPRFSRHLIGTSNCDIARRVGIPAVGTQAHEWYQAFQQLSPDLRLSQATAMKMWLREYPNCLGIALTDCITMDAFLKDFNYALASAYIGLRQDSGDPVEWGRKAIEHYRALGIDPKQKVLVFSDGLNLEKAAELYNMFKEQTTVMCGIGTYLSCTIDGVRRLNIVIKMVRCQGRPVAKVSDSPGKTICEDSTFVEKLLRVFNVPNRPIAKCHKVMST